MCCVQDMITPPSIASKLVQELTNTFSVGQVGHLMCKLTELSCSCAGCAVWRADKDSVAQERCQVCAFCTAREMSSFARHVRRYVTNEIYFDLVEQIDCITNANGNMVTCNVRLTAPSGSE